MRVVFEYADDNGLVDRPVRYGQNFERPSRKVVHIDRAKKGPKLFTAADVRRLMSAASVPMRAMILLGINAGLGNADCGNLPLATVNLDASWLDYPRPKTDIARRCILWPETVEAIRAALAVRPAPKQEEHAGLVFITRYGEPVCLT
jgi:integrase